MDTAAKNSMMFNSFRVNKRDNTASSSRDDLFAFWLPAVVFVFFPGMVLFAEESLRSA